MRLPKKINVSTNIVKTLFNTCARINDVICILYFILILSCYALEIQRVNNSSVQHSIYSKYLGQRRNTCAMKNGNNEYSGTIDLNPLSISRTAEFSFSEVVV